MIYRKGDFVGGDGLAQFQSAAAGSGGGAAISAAGASASNGTVVFSNSNGVSFGMNGSTVTATVATNYLTTAMASNRGSDFVQATAGFNGTNCSGTIASNSISVSVGNYITTAMASNRGSDFVQATAAFNGTNASGTIASNAISISVAAPGGGAANSASWHVINDGMIATVAAWNNATYSNRPIFIPFKMGEAITAINSIDLYASRTGGTSASATLHAGIYTVANVTSMNLVSSTSFAISLTTSAQFSGVRRLQWTGLGAMSLSPGQYVFGLLASVAGTASWGMALLGGSSPSLAGVIHPGTNSTAATASGTHIQPFQGVWNATSGALPGAVAASSISGGNVVNSPNVQIILKAISA